MFDRQSLSSLLTLLGGVAASVMVIAMQPEAFEEPPVIAQPAAPASVAFAGHLSAAQPTCPRPAAEGPAPATGEAPCGDDFARWTRERSAP